MRLRRARGMTPREPARAFSPIDLGELSLQPIISVSGLSKTYTSGFQALKKINLEIRQGEIFALLGPNGAGKTTLINIICGIVNPTGGAVMAGGHDIVRDYRAARSKIGLVPQELSTDAFETVWATASFSRGLFGKPANPAHIEKVLQDLSLWDKKDSQIRMLSGGMKRRVMIAKALSHEPQILFLDEPTAGVDVELRRDMWDMVRSLRATGVTIILTTHYIEEAEEMADRIGVISKGEIILVEDKAALMTKLGKKRLTLHLQRQAGSVPAGLAGYQLDLSASGNELVYTFDAQRERTGIATLMKQLNELGIDFKDLQTNESSLEEIFVEPCEGKAMNVHAIRAIYLFEMARTWRTLHAEHRRAGDFDIALFRCLRRGHRLAHDGDRRGQLRRLHRAGLDHAVAPDREHLQRLLRHLFPEVFRHNL